MDEIDALGRAHIILGVLNFTATESLVSLPSGTSFPVWLSYSGSSLTEAIASENVWKAWYSTAIVFDLRNPCTHSRCIPKGELMTHGMRLHTM